MEILLYVKIAVVLKLEYLKSGKIRNQGLLFEQCVKPPIQKEIMQSTLVVLYCQNLF